MNGVKVRGCTVGNSLDEASLVSDNYARVNDRLNLMNVNVAYECVEEGLTSFHVGVMLESIFLYPS